MLLFLYKKDLNPIRLPILLAVSVYVFTSHSLLWYRSICSRKSFWAQLGHSVSIQSIILGVVRDFHFCKSSFLATNRAQRRHPSWLEHRSLLWHPWTFYGWLVGSSAGTEEKKFQPLSADKWTFSCCCHLASRLDTQKKCIGQLDTISAFALFGVKTSMQGERNSRKHFTPTLP